MSSSSPRLESARPARHPRGFTLLEAIVALALVAGLGGAIFVWVNQSLASVNRVNEVYAELEARRNMAQWLRMLNPMVQPSGRRDFGDFVLEWSSKPLVGPVDQMGYPAGTGLYEVGLYEVRMLWRGRGTEIVDTRTLAGYRKVRTLDVPFLMPQQPGATP